MPNFDWEWFAGVRTNECAISLPRVHSKGSVVDMRLLEKMY